MQEIMKGNPNILSGLEALCDPDAGRATTDSFGNAYYWFRLRQPAQILDAATLLHAQGARLAMIAAYSENREKHLLHDACYEFVQGGVVYNITVNTDASNDSIPSITPIFANADWHEREMMELFGIKITAHPNPRRLFLDEKLDAGLMGEIVPLSVLMNGANSTDLWERILSDKESKS